MKAHGSRSSQRGGFLVGFVVGILIGLAAALAVALYVTKAPVPFVNKVPMRSPASAAITATAPRGSQATASLGGGAFTYFVQAGAYSRSEDAEQQRAKLAMLGMDSRLTEREQGGKMVYRVRVGPFDRREDAESTKEKLAGSGVDAALVAVQK